MTTTKDFLNALDRIAPFSLAEQSDNVGLLLGSEDTEAAKALLALDVTVPVVEEAERLGVNLIITHHPVIFYGLKSVSRNSIPWRLIAAGISVISAHTNLDIAEGGVNDVLAKQLGITDISNLNKAGIGRVGQLEREMLAEDFAAFVKEKLSAPCVRFSGKGQSVRKIALCSGSGADYFEDVIACGADAYVTGEMKHHVWMESVRTEIAVVEAGHFHTEDVIMPELAERLRILLPDTEIILSRVCSDGISALC